MERFQRMGIEVMGANSTITGAYNPVYRTLKGVKLTFLAFNAVKSPDDSWSKDLEIPGYSMAVWNDEKVLKAISTAHSHSGVVIVSIHWGMEYDSRPNWWQEEKARMMVEAGADLVIGHHPHVIQKADIIKMDNSKTTNRFGLVAYSLGNFVFDQYDEKTDQGLALRALLDKDGLCGVQTLPVWTTPRPRLMSPDEMGKVVEIVRPAAKRIGFACDRKECVEVDVPQEVQRGIFQDGQIDLTGDGEPELVLRYSTGAQAGQAEEYDQGEGWVAIIQNGVQVWRSPSQWRVLDVALGDPNDDGRYELMLALKKPDRDGVIRSNPFIIGYRGGSYRDVWGGSAVANPIRELELGDLDSDGVQELVVLEEHGDDSRQAVTVWRWNGWGFTLEWRSREGRYRDLVLFPGKDGGMVISVGELW
jgi:poly-gamma-glutamate synthesis protein (capsule biosynthesis protein)